jgi:hypothetical protein
MGRKGCVDNITPVKLIIKPNKHSTMISFLMTRGALLQWGASIHETPQPLLGNVYLITVRNQKLRSLAENPE